MASLDPRIVRFVPSPRAVAAESAWRTASAWPAASTLDAGSTDLCIRPSVARFAPGPVAAGLLIAAVVASAFAPRASAQPPAARPAPSAELPWTQKGSPGKPTARRAQTARELLVNVEDSQLAMFRDGVDWSVDEDETLFRILYRTPKFGPYDTLRLTKPFDPQAVAAAPADARAGLFRIEGRVEAVERVEVLPEIARRLEFDHYWRVRLRLAGSPHRAILCSRWTPEPWRDADSLDERAAAAGVFLKTSAPVDDVQTFVFATERVEWYPDRVESRFGVRDDHVLLASLGVDFSRFADLQGRDAKPLGSADRECFYQLLAAAGRATPEQTAASPPFELGPFLQRPAEHHGRRTRVAGRCKRVTEIAVEDPELAERFGFSRYYELDVIVPLGDQEVRLASGPGDRDGPVLSNGYPVVCCVRELPPELRSSAQRSDVNEEVVVDGFFFRLWSYQSAFLDQFAADEAERRERAGGGAKGAGAAKGDAAGKGGAEGANRRRQPSPLFIGGRAQVVAGRRSATDGYGLIVGGVLAAGAALAFGYHWATGRADRRARERMRRTLDRSAPGEGSPR